MKSTRIKAICYDQEGKKNNIVCLVTTDSLSKAEETVRKELEGFDNIEISTIQKVDIAAIISEPPYNKRWYKLKTVLTVLNEKTAKERIITKNILVHASGIPEAVKLLDHALPIGDFEVTQAVLAPIDYILSPAPAPIP